ncbi:MAG: alpha/beta hydrolase [Nocardioidaceae bacterium]
MTRTCTPRRARAVVLGALVLALGVSACGSAQHLVAGDPSASRTPRSSPATSTTGPGVAGGGNGPADLASFYGQHATWSACGSYDCTTIKVPIDYSDPSGPTVTLHLKRQQATSSPDLGPLFINPGGPGGSGLNFVDQFTGEAPELLSHYDVIGFDPRGVGTSDPLQCLNNTQLDTFVSFDPDPDTPSEVSRAEQLVKQMGAACEQHSGELAAHVSTIEVARDLDIMRAVLGSPKLTYYGASYGTYIGATYAELFPTHVGKMVLDGALDPMLGADASNLGQARGFQTALDSYVADCVSHPSCPLGQDQQAALTKMHGFLQGLDQHPLPTSDPSRPLTEALGFYGVAVTLYNRDYWQYLTQALSAAFQGNGSALLLLADAYLSRNADGSYQDNSAQVIYAVNCLDHPEPLDPAQIAASVPRYDKVAPTFGSVFAWSAIGCAEWPIKPTLKPLTKFNAPGAPPIVVVGTTRDPATPYAWAKSLASELDSGVFLSRNGDGHTAFHRGNGCIDRAIDDYFLSDKVPANNTMC